MSNKAQAASWESRHGTVLYWPTKIDEAIFPLWLDLQTYLNQYCAVTKDIVVTIMEIISFVPGKCSCKFKLAIFNQNMKIDDDIFM